MELAPMLSHLVTRGVMEAAFVNARVDLTHLRPFKNDPPPYHKNTDGLFGFGAEGSFRWGVG